MAKNVLLIDCCVHGEQSRTLKLARRYLDTLEDVQVNHQKLYELNLAPLSYEETVERKRTDIAETFAQADAICLLEPPLALCRRRVIRRYYRRKRDGSGHGETLRSLRALLRWMDSFQTRNLPAIREALAPYAGKTLRITKAMPAGDILAALEDIL